MNDAQKTSLEQVSKTYNVLNWKEQADLISVEVTNGSTHYFFIDQQGEVVNEDGDGVTLDTERTTT